MTALELIEGVNSGKFIITTSKELAKFAKEEISKMDKVWLTTQEACDVLDISQRTFYVRLKDPKCLVQKKPTQKVLRGKGNTNLYLKSSVEAEKRRR